MKGHLQHSYGCLDIWMNIHLCKALTHYVFITHKALF